MGVVLQISMLLKYVCDCYKCGVPIAMTADFERRRRLDHGEWYCINGHAQAWMGKSELEKLREALDAQRAETERQRAARERAERETAAQRGQVTKIKNRIGNGVCPCCKRTFQNVHRHMLTKHPTYKNDDHLTSPREGT